MLTARPRVRFFRPTKVEKLGQSHVGLVDFVGLQLRQRVPYARIADLIFRRWEERVSPQVLSKFWRLRLWPRLCAEERDWEKAVRHGKATTGGPGH